MCFVAHQQDKGTANYEIALLNAIRHSEFKIVRFLLKAGINPLVKYRDSNEDCFPIQVAAEIGNVQVITALVEYGADLAVENTRTNPKFKPIEILATYGHWDCVMRIAAIQKEPEKEKKFGYGDVLIVGIREGLYDVVESLSRNGVRHFESWILIHIGTVKNVKMLALLSKYNLIREKKVQKMLRENQDPAIESSLVNYQKLVRVLSMKKFLWLIYILLLDNKIAVFTKCLQKFWNI